MEREETAAAVRPLLVVDGANVVGSVPDGWWRDRRGAAERLRDALVAVAERGLPELPGPLDVVLVVEGAARGVAGLPEVRVVEASGSGDDRIVDVVRSARVEHPHRACLVATADRELRTRVTALGATTTGPRSVRP
ncbi:NTP pyrophosphohydrolase [Kitasatospora sp. NPDC101183]|uniref:NTP pyrophosphohydrolase n=1 Tax=Kitasatospora sp. NPDC101183 TaxID=3364100 RepID=UPI0038173CA4